MNKKILVESEVRVLDLINELQNKVNENNNNISFNSSMEKYFKEATSEITGDDFVRFRITLLNLEELNLIAGDVLNSPHITDEGKDILAYYKERESIIKRLVGIFVIIVFINGIVKIIKNINKEGK